MDDAKFFLDASMGAITVGALFSWLPHITALLALIWWIIRIYETNTVQGWINKRNDKE